MKDVDSAPKEARALFGPPGLMSPLTKPSPSETEPVWQPTPHSWKAGNETERKAVQEANNISILHVFVRCNRRLIWERL